MSEYDITRESTLHLVLRYATYNAPIFFYMRFIQQVHAQRLNRLKGDFGSAIYAMARVTDMSSLDLMKDVVDFMASRPDYDGVCGK